MSASSKGRSAPAAQAWFDGSGIQNPGSLSIGRDFIFTSNMASTHDHEVQCCLSDLYVTDPSDDMRKLKRKKGDRASGTCEWILDTEYLTTWLDSEQMTKDGQAANVSWLHGNPGTGKSTMAMFLIENLSEVFSAEDGRTLAYFFCDSSFEKRNTATSVIRGLLYQLVKQHSKLLTYILPKYNERRKRLKDELFEDFDALWAMLMNVAADQDTGSKYCIIDALDECDRESQVVLLQQLHRTFQSQDAPPNIRILVTSRPYDEIREHLEDFSNRDLASFPAAKQDIYRCIEEKLADLTKKKRYTDKIQQKVRDILREKAAGTFLWVGLACRELEDRPSMDAVRFLQGIPEGLDSLYSRLLETALEWNRSEIQRILSFVAVCLRPLTVLELAEACQLHEDEKNMETRIQFTREHIASCRLMVIIQDEKVLLLHQSVKDFLTGPQVNHIIDELDAHAQLSYRCVDLLITQFRDKKQSKTHLSEYATENWVDHARMAQSVFEVKVSQEEFFALSSPSREYWLELHRGLHPYYPVPQQFSFLHIAARWGLAALIKHVCCIHDPRPQTSEVNYNVECPDTSHTTPLVLAIQYHNLEVVSILLSLGAIITPLVMSTVAGEGDKETMALLLDRRRDEITITEEVVKAAAGNYSSSRAVMELLLDRRGDEITITEEVVVAAASGGSEEAMELLLDQRGDEITITDEVVKAAVGNGWSGREVMELLLDRRGDEIIITEQVTRAAAVCGQLQVLRLLSHKSLATIRDEWWCTARFYNAAESGDVILIRELLDAGTNPDSSDTRGTTPLWIAAANGHETVVRILAQRVDVNINSRSISGRSPLFWPSHDGQEQIVEILIEAGADTSFTDVNGDTAITMARRNGHVKIVKMLEVSGNLREGPPNQAIHHSTDVMESDEGQRKDITIRESPKMRDAETPKQLRDFDAKDKQLPSIPEWFPFL